jgi:hypothetical protein
MTNTTQMSTNKALGIGREPGTMNTLTTYQLARARARIQELEAEAAGARLAARAQPGSTRWTGLRARLVAAVNRAPAAVPATPSVTVANAGAATVDGPAGRPLAPRGLDADPDRATSKVVGGCPPVCDSAATRAA